MKKLAVFTLILTLLLMSFVACGEDGASSSILTSGGDPVISTKPDTTSTSDTVKDPLTGSVAGEDLLYPVFLDPCEDMTAKPLWFWNTSLENMTTDRVREIVRESYLQSGYSGFGILPYWLEGYLGERYFELYEAALDEGAKYGMQFSLYDENGFPSYTAGGHLAARYPDLTAKRLDMTESSRVKNGKIFLGIPQGEFMGAVAWNKTTGEIVDISKSAVIVDLGGFDPSLYPIGVTASSTYTEAGGYEIDKALDKNAATRWNAYQHSGSGVSITINFGKAVSLDEVKLYEPADAQLQRVRAWSVSYYDLAAKEWKELGSSTTIGKNGKSISFESLTASFIRISFDRVEGDSATISEIEVYSGGSRIDIPKASAQTAGYAASSIFSEQYAAKFAFDGDASTRWNAEDGQRVNQWIAIDFGKAVTVDGMEIEEAFDRVTAYAVQYQAADGTWVDCHTGTRLGASAKISFDAVTARSFRLMMKSVSSDTASIVECRFYHGADEVYLEEDPSTYTGSYLEYTVSGDDDITVMAFVTVKDGHKGMDYLSEESVAAFIEITYEEYYKRFKAYFDNGTITSAFYDEPCFWPSNQNYGVQGARTWTGDFNEYFASMYGEDVNPILYYPAMFYDIGEKTAEARDALNRVRTEMFAKNYIGQMNEWCQAHGLELLGHMNCEDVESPLAYHGDLMYCFKYQSAPSVDVIYNYGMTEDYYKVVSSSAYNWDKPLVGVEAYGAMDPNLSEDAIYKIAMDLYAKGINVMVPHAVWYDNRNNVVFPPELSYRNPNYTDVLKPYNTYVARVQTLLQKGRHVADVAVLYPIDYMESVYLFNNSYNIPTDSNYVKLTELLSETLRIDYTYLHPSVLDERVTVKDGLLHLENEVNYEDYRVMILPSMGVISLSNLQKVKEFYDKGGIVISVGTVPTRATKAEEDAAVKALAEELFSVAEKTNAAGGKAYHVSGVAAVNQLMKKVCPVYDVTIDSVRTVNGHLTYIHKVIEDRNVYFFANSSESASKTTVTLRGEFPTLEVWDPHTGEKKALSVTVENGTTSFTLSMERVSSLFIVEKKG